MRHRTTPPHPGAVEKVHRRSAPNFTPPLRGSRRGRVSWTKADSVGGYATEKAPPTSAASGLRPRLADSPSRGEWFFSLLGRLHAPNHEIGTFSTNPFRGGFGSAFPRICGYRPAWGCGRISRERRRGGVLMETGHAKKGKRRSAPDRGRSAGSVRPATLFPAVGMNPPALVGFYLSRPETEREGRAGNFDKIPKNTINIDKLTGFFDKKRKRENIANRCNKTTCFTYLSRGDSNTAANFFHARICPHFR